MESQVVRLRGLPWGVSDNDIVQFLKDVSIAPNGIYLLKDSQGRASGEAYVRVSDRANLEKALALNKEYMGSRYVEVFESREDDLAAATTVSEEGPRDNCFVRLRGVPFDCNEIQVKQFLEPLQPVDVQFAYNRDGRMSGEVYVELLSEEDVQRALEKDKQTIGCRYIEVFPSNRSEFKDRIINQSSRYRSMGARPPFPRRDNFNRYNPYGPPPMGAPVQTPGYYDYSMPSQQQPMYQDQGGYQQYNQYGQPSYQPAAVPAAPGYPPMPATESSRVRLRGIPYHVTDHDIYAFFNGYNYISGSCEMGKDASGRASGFAWIDFQTPQEAARACRDLNRRYIGSRYVELFVV